MARTEHLLVDGNNLLHSEPTWRRTAASDFDAARRLLVQSLDACAGTLADRITVVFDSDSGRPADEFAGASVTVEYAPARWGADAVIERKVAEARSPTDILVVTSDRGERLAVEASGALSMSCAAFLEELDHHRSRGPRLPRSPGARRGARGPTLGDYFPD